MEPRLITMNDEYPFDRNAKVSIEPFIDIIGRRFTQPEEGLGLDDSPSSAHVTHDRESEPASLIS